MSFTIFNIIKMSLLKAKSSFGSLVSRACDRGFIITLLDSIAYVNSEEKREKEIDRKFKDVENSKEKDKIQVDNFFHVIDKLKEHSKEVERRCFIISKFNRAYYSRSEHSNEPFFIRVSSSLFFSNL